MEDFDHSPAEIIKQLFVDLSLVTSNLSSPWACFINSTPDSPDNVFVVSDTAPVTNGRIQFDGRTVQREGISVVVRGLNPNEAWKKLRTIQVEGIDKVHRRKVTLTPTSGNGTATTTYRVNAIDLSSGILSLGKEVSTGNRFLFSLNALASITPLSIGE